MKLNPNDHFDLNLCIRGLGNQLTFMHSNLYEFAYYLTFKNSLKIYQDEFTDPWAMAIEDHEFFARSTDPFVKLCADAVRKLIYCKLELCVRWGITEAEDLKNPVIELEESRFEPYYLQAKHAKTYNKMNLYVARMIADIINSLYLYACAITVQSYKVPLKLKKQLQYPGKEGVRMLDQSENNVALLTELILDLGKILSDYEFLIENKGNTEKTNRVKAVVTGGR